jgi:hypothetical protein
VEKTAGGGNHGFRGAAKTLRNSGIKQCPEIFHDPDGARKKGLFPNPNRKNNGAELAPGSNPMPGIS